MKSHRLYLSAPILLAFFLAFISALTLSGAALSAQDKKKDKDKDTPIPAHAHAPDPAVTDEYVHKQFGDDCSLLQGPAQFVADLDGDGVEDLIVAARCKNPVANQAEYSYVVDDPYMTFLGFGDTRVTSSFDSERPERKGVCLLIVEGTGPDAWRAEKPKAKYLMINLPFKTLSVKRLK